MGNDPQPEMQDTTHTYVARVWYRDSTTVVTIIGFVLLIVQDHDFAQIVPEKYHLLLAKVVLLLTLVLRYTSATRPVGLREGETREVRSIPPKV